MIIAAYLLVFGGFAFLQTFLSRRENRWLGMVLPIISFLVSIVFVSNVIATGNVGSTMLTMALVFLLCNIPTAIFLVIYFACRERSKRKRDLEKMSAQDL